MKVLLGYGCSCSQNWLSYQPHKGKLGNNFHFVQMYINKISKLHCGSVETSLLHSLTQ